MRITALILSLACINAFARQYTLEELEGISAYREKMRSDSQKGDAKAQLLMGISYQFGYNGCERNPKEAVLWYIPSAMQGNADAMFNLAACYQDGDGVEKNLIEAFAYYTLAKRYNRTLGVEERLGEVREKLSQSEIERGLARSKELYYTLNPKEKAREEAEIKQKEKAIKEEKDRQDAEVSRQLTIMQEKADQGDPDAEFKIGCAYASGVHGQFPKDDRQAVAWYLKAAKQGHAEAEYQLGLCSYNGNGAPKDIILSYALFDIAGNSLKKARDELTKIQKEMTDAQILAGQKRSREIQKQIEANIAKKDENPMFNYNNSGR